MNEILNMRGDVTLRLTDREGRVVAEQHRRNRIVKSGRRLVAELFAGVPGGTPPSKVTHMAVGTGAAAAADEQTALTAQRGPRKDISEVTFTEFDETAGGGITTRRVRATLKAVFDFADANDVTVPLREAGVFTADTGGVMYNRVVFEPVTKTEAFKLTLLWDITF